MQGYDSPDSFCVNLNNTVTLALLLINTYNNSESRASNLLPKQALHWFQPGIPSKYISKYRNNVLGKQSL